MSKSIYDQIRATTDINQALELIKALSYEPYLDHPEIQIGDFVRVTNPEFYKKYNTSFAEILKDKIFRVAMIIKRDSNSKPYVWLAENNINPYVEHLEFVSRGLL